MQKKSQLFIGNLSFDTKEGDLKDAFSPCGEIIEITVPKNPHSDKCKGFAFITFKEEQAAVDALGKDGLMINGRPIRVNHAKERSDEPRSNRGGFGGEKKFNSQRSGERSSGGFKGNSNSRSGGGHRSGGSSGGYGGGGGGRSFGGNRSNNDDRGNSWY